MLKNKKIVLLIVGIAGIFFIVAGILLSSKGKGITTSSYKTISLNGNFTSRVGDSLVVSSDKKYSYYDLTGKKLAEFDSEVTLDDITLLSNLGAKDSLYVVSDDFILYGVVNFNKTEVLPKQYLAVKIISKVCFLVQGEDFLWSVVNEKGEAILDTKYDSFDIYDGAGVVLVKDYKYDIIDEEGNLVSKNKYEYVVDYSKDTTRGEVLCGQYGDGAGDLFIFQKNKFNLIEGVGGSIVVNDKYVYYANSEGTFNSYSLVDGKTKNEVEVDFSINGMNIMTTDEGLLGYRSADGKKVIKEKYQIDGSGNFTEYGVAVVSLNNLQGVIDKDGKEILPCKYNYVYVLSDKAFAISDDYQDYYLVDSSNKKVYDKITYDDNYDFVITYNKDKCGIVDRYGKMLYDTKYTDCQIYNNTFILNEGNKNWVVGKYE